MRRPLRSSALLLTLGSLAAALACAPSGPKPEEIEAVARALEEAKEGRREQAIAALRRLARRTGDPGLAQRARAEADRLDALEMRRRRALDRLALLRATTDPLLLPGAAAEADRLAHALDGTPFETEVRSAGAEAAAELRRKREEARRRDVETIRQDVEAGEYRRALVRLRDFEGRWGMLDDAEVRAWLDRIDEAATRTAESKAQTEALEELAARLRGTAAHALLLQRIGPPSDERH